MADQSDEQSWRPILLALAALAAAGWLAAGFMWWQGGQTQSYDWAFGLPNERANPWPRTCRTSKRRPAPLPT
jgi:hypothetical protein